MVWYPYPISFLDWLADRKERKRPKTNAAKLPALSNAQPKHDDSPEYSTSASIELSVREPSARKPPATDAEAAAYGPLDGHLARAAHMQSIDAVVESGPPYTKAGDKGKERAVREINLEDLRGTHSGPADRKTGGKGEERAVTS